MQQTNTLIVGAGPSGLVLALWLAKAGVPLLIIDKAAGPGTTSRATVFHARNLEFYHQMGIDRQAIDGGIAFNAMNLWVKGTRRARLPFGLSGEDISPYPYSLIYPQDRHEAMLTEHLARLGIKVMRNITLVSFTEDARGVQAILQQEDGSQETVQASFLAGCDGAHSTVRHALGTGFSGAAYANVFYVADLEIRGAMGNGEMHMALDEADFLAIFPMKGEGRVRLIGSVRQDVADHTGLSWDDVNKKILHHLDMEVTGVRWFSTYRIHHRVADHFRKGNVFLLGDAGHIHSPVGGQGMNTGIGDAVNLAWKIAAVAKGRAPQALLDTYEAERIGFARRLVASTDRAFSFVSRRSRLAAFVRTRIVPPLMSFLFRFQAFRRLMFVTLSQTTIRYPESPLSGAGLGRLRSGDRLPWIRLPDGKDNIAPLTAMDWQVHCYGQMPDALEAVCKRHGVPLQTFTWSAAMQQAGLVQGAAYAIRPDGYIGHIAARHRLDSLGDYLERWGAGYGSAS